MTAQPSPAPAPSYPTVGTVINGKYRVEQILGEGGVGIVVAATHVELGERVALKFLRAEMLERADVVGRFMFEAKAASTIKSDHSATVFDVGRTESGVPFLVMEFLEGRDLATVIEHGPLDVRDVAEFAMHTCEALAAAHAKGIVHRDIKPENLFLSMRLGMRSIKVLDFGISKTALTGSAISSLLPMVQTQNLMGTPLYMSPEQIRAPENVDARTDIYALGVVMYEALTGTLPIMSDSITELCAAILEQKPTPITQYRQDLPLDLVAVIDKCLAKNQEDRFQNAAEVAIALLPFAPKRARICAERAGEVLVAAGLVTPESVRFASDIPSSLASGSHPAFRVPPHPVLTPISAAPSQSAFTVPSGVVSLAPAPPKNRKKVIIAAAVAVLGLVGAVVAFTHRGNLDADAKTPAVPASTQAASTPPPPTETIPPPEPRAAAELAESTPVQSATAIPKAPSTGVPVAHPAAVPVTAPARPARPAAPAGKKPDALDIGY